ncbi:hypothetical protein PT974_06199 [Cladobotryum mycophilum]|uniref:Clr5 domain-containing protein n=1 Tax=Cladobotryum mycophilum TaxID=491253 RepID=A0ABR0SKW7_9HYPO
MVGSAQYRDEEIGWVLNAVVARKNQEYIQHNFEELFGRPLNHNQIRYIKNKYGKDPKFNSPLVNIRSSRTATSPPASVLGAGDQEDDAISIATTTASERQRRQSHSRGITPQAGNQAKRKRSSEDDGGESSVQHMAKTQRPNLPPHPHYTRGTSAVPNTPQWTAVGGAQLAASLHSLSPPPPPPPTATPEITLATTSASMHLPPAFLQNDSSSPVELNYYAEQTPASYTFPSPVITYHNLHHHQQQHQQQTQVSQPYPTNMPPPPTSFSPPMPHPLLYSPNIGGEPQRQLPPTQLPLQPQPRPQQQPQQQFQQQPQPQPQPEVVQYSPNQDFSSNQMPTESNSAVDSLCSKTIKHEPTTGPLPMEPPVAQPPGGTQNPWMVNYAPYEPLPFDPVAGPISWPFGNVKNVGLTSTASKDIRRAVREQERRRRQDLAASAQGPSPPIPEHFTHAPHISPITASLELLNMARHPAPPGTAQPDANQYAAAVYARALQSCLGTEFTPRTATTVTTTAQVQQAQAQESAFAGTIDPQLLTDQQIASFTLPGEHSVGISPSQNLP